MYSPISRWNLGASGPSSFHCQGCQGSAYHMASHDPQADRDPLIPMDRGKHRISVYKVQVLPPVLAAIRQAVKDFSPVPLRNH